MQQQTDNVYAYNAHNDKRKEAPKTSSQGAYVFGFISAMVAISAYLLLQSLASRPQNTNRQVSDDLLRQEQETADMVKGFYKLCVTVMILAMVLAVVKHLWPTMF